MKFLLGYFTCFFMVLWAYLVFGNMNRKNCLTRTLLYMLGVCAKEDFRNSNTQKKVIAWKPLLKCTSDQITEFCEKQGVL